MCEFSDLQFSWKRPAEIPYPNVWHKFETTPSQNRTTFKVRIQDLPADRIDEAVEFMTKYFILDEPLRRSVNFSEDKISVTCQQYLWTRLMVEKMTLVAVLDEDIEKPQIIAVQVYSVISNRDPPLPKLHGKAREKMDRVFNMLKGNFNPLKYFQRDSYLYDWGICVSSEFRGLSVAFNLMDSIKWLAKAVNIDVIVIVCNSIKTQIIAEKIGCKKYRSIRYADCRDEDGQPICLVEGTEMISIYILSL